MPDLVWQQAKLFAQIATDHFKKKFDEARSKLCSGVVEDHISSSIRKAMFGGGE